MKSLDVGFYVPTVDFLAIQEHTAVMDADTQRLVAVTGPAQNSESLAFARLFAAAPVMLEALEAMEEYTRSCVHTIGEREQMARMAVKAIKKAKGL